MAVPTRTVKEVKAAQKIDKAQAKQARKAEKIRRKNSSDPKDMGRFKQIGQAYKLTHEFDKPLPWILLAAFLVPVIFGVVVGLLIAQTTYTVILSIVTGVMVGILAAMLVLVRRVKKATFNRYAGQAGSAEVALSMLDKKWLYTSAISVTRHQDVIHRALGPGGIVLVGEGEAGRIRQMLASEQKKHEKVAYGVKVSTLVMGDKQGQIPLNKVADHIKKLPKVLQAHQITDVKARLRALDAVRPKVPIPRGPVPTSMRGSRSAMRGR